MIEIKNLTKKFPGVIAVNDLSLEIHPGVNGLVGENGAGKSTLLRLISDVIAKDEGTILIDGKDNSDKSIKSNLFFLSDNPYFPNNATEKDVVELYSSLFNLNVDRFYSILGKLDLPKNRRLSTFSKGMRRQFFLAITLAMDVDYYLLDEAFDGLDPVIQEVVKDEIITNSKEKTFLISSHNLLTLEKLCDNFIILSKGRATKFGEQIDLGHNFKKYQIIFKDEINKEDLNQIGIKVLSLKKTGSITYLVSEGENDLELIKEKFSPTLIENVPIDNEEIIRLEMVINRAKEE